jgi:hypothetical protein
MSNDSFNGQCPTCGQEYLRDEIKRLRADLAFYDNKCAKCGDHLGLLAECPHCREIKSLRAEKGAALSLLREIRRELLEDGCLSDNTYQELCSATDGEMTGAGELSRLRSEVGKYKGFVIECAAVQNHEGWQGAYFRKAKGLLLTGDSDNG